MCSQLPARVMAWILSFSCSVALGTAWALQQLLGGQQGNSDKAADKYGYCNGAAPTPLPCCSSPSMCIPGSWSISNPWKCASLGKHEAGASPSLLCRAGGSRAQADPTPTRNSSLPECEATFPEKGILLQASGKHEVQEQFQRWIPSHRQCTPQQS